MRIAKLLAMTLVVLALGAAGLSAATDTATTNATFIIPSWISLSVVENGSVSFPEITGPGTYEATEDTRLRVLSTKSWSLTEAILWVSSVVPTGADQATVERVFTRTPDLTSESWGVWFINVDYVLDVSADDLAEMPEGTYNVVVQYTATTD